MSHALDQAGPASVADAHPHDQQAHAGGARRAGRRWGLALATTAALLGTAGSAGATTTAAVNDGVLEVRGSPGVNRVSVIESGDQREIVVSDPVELVTAGPGCAGSPSFTTCATAGLTAVHVDLGEGDDQLMARVALPVSAWGDGGDDQLVMDFAAGGAPAQPAYLDGGPGDDRLVGTTTADTLLGGDGDDDMDGGAGDDLIVPGPGEDSVLDSGGADRVLAADGRPDFVNCGPGTDVGTFDSVDRTLACEQGAPSAAATPRCAPQISRLRPRSLSELRRSRSLRIATVAEPACTITATLSSGVGSARVTLSRSRAVAAGRPLVLPIRSSTLRKLRSARVLRVRIEARAPGSRGAARSLRLLITH
jgi:hypothetical protein